MKVEFEFDGRKVQERLEKMVDKDKVMKELVKGGLAIEADAKKLCPVRTGNLMRSIHTEKTDDEVSVGTPVEYAPFVEFGTSKMEAQPYLQPAFEKHKDKIIKNIREVMING